MRPKLTDLNERAKIAFKLDVDCVETVELAESALLPISPPPVSLLAKTCTC